MSNSVNEANFAAFEARRITSASVMPPCQHVSGVVSFARMNTDLDIGLHLTLTSECPNSRWKPLSSDAREHGLCDIAGYFHANASDLADSAEDVSKELLAQFTFLSELGLIPHHIDSHMFSAFASAGVCSSYLQGVEAAKVPALVPAYVWEYAMKTRPTMMAKLPKLNIITISESVSPDDWLHFYLRAVRNLPLGISILLVHLGFDTRELRRIRDGRATHDAAWRQRDAEAIMSDQFHDALKSEDVKLISWRDV